MHILHGCIFIWYLCVCTLYAGSCKYLHFGASNEFYEKKVSTAVTNNSTNINKANNHLSLQIIEHKNTTFPDGNPGAGFGHVHTFGGVKTPNEIPLFPLSALSRFHNWLPVTVGWFKKVLICICFTIAVPPLRVDTHIQQSNETLSIYIHVERVYPRPQCSVVIGVSKTKRHWYTNFIFQVINNARWYST